MKIPLLVLTVFLCQPLCAQEASGDAQRGARLYLDFACYTCHGYHGTGMTPLSREASGVLSSQDLFLTYLRLRADQRPVNPSRAMPHYSSDVLDDEQALDIYAYLVALRDDPPQIEDIPAFMEILQAAQEGADGETANE